MERLREVDPNIIGVDIATLYFLILKDKKPQLDLFNADEFIKERIYKLLDIDDKHGGQGWPPWRSEQSELDKLFYVVPRQGTISPWSSKATDIFHICNMDDIARVERGFGYRLQFDESLKAQNFVVGDALKEKLYDRMTEYICSARTDIENWMHVADIYELSGWQVLGAKTPSQSKSQIINLSIIERKRISTYIKDYGENSALSEDELLQLEHHYYKLGRIPTETELMMYEQVNSEHCRHKLFNAHWILDSKPQKQTLFEMIKSTHTSDDNVISAYRDNASVVAHALVDHFHIDPKSRQYAYEQEQQPFLIKVETHNHPTAISPFPGAATGSGGEIRDESATGCGGRPRMGLVGFSLSDLHIPDFEQPWESPPKYPEHIASALQIITEGPLGAARFNNEFGRPCVCGYFRTYERQDEKYHWGYHKPIMIAGGLGSIRKKHVHKEHFAADTPLVVFGGPAMRIGLGGGSASSASGGSSSQDLDFESVQRDNAEMQRRCQEVIEQCTALSDNPILSIHDVGAGGLSNAMPELVHDADLGAHIDLRAIPCADEVLLPMEIWCNESQERYVAAIGKWLLDEFAEICRRERCPMAVIGKATEDKQLVLEDTSSPYEDTTIPVDMPMSVLFPEPVADHRPLKSPAHYDVGSCNWQDIDLEDAIEQVLKIPAVASKGFLITIGDRSVTGLICRDQMVGPWQVPVSDVAVSANSYTGYSGEAMAMGERTPVAIYNAPASGRLAITEAILNIAAADIDNLSDICLSANWMAAANLDEQRYYLYETVRALTDLCRSLKIAIPVGKDSLSMQMQWQDKDQYHQVNSPLSLIVSAFAPVVSVNATLTPQLDVHSPQKRIFLIDLSDGDNRLGGSCLMQAYGREGEPPDMDNPQRLIDFFKLLRELRADDDVLAYHDRSDGGLLVSLIEMAFAANCGVSCELNDKDELIPTLFSEAPGVLLQLSEGGAKRISRIREQYKDTLSIREIGRIRADQNFEVTHNGQSWTWELMNLKQWWSETSTRIQALRDDPQCAAEEMESLCDANNPGLTAECNFEVPSFNEQLTVINEPHSINIKNKKPKVAILREQGVNGHIEMAAAFERANFAAYDIHMSDLINGKVDLSKFQGLAACGGFSYGDVLGAGAGWAHSILMHDSTREAFETFFNRPDTFALGVCNGCQMLSRIKEIIPGANHWPTFEANRSNQFESRLVKVQITPSPSVLFNEMEGARLPIVVAHGEGRAVFPNIKEQADATDYTCLRYIDNYNHTTEHYPENPNGSPQGVTAFCSKDGRVTIMMPHPERLFRTIQYSWHDSRWGEAAPWFKLFHNAYRFCKES